MQQIRMQANQQKNAEKLYGFLSPKTFAKDENRYQSIGRNINLPLLRLSIGAPIDEVYAYQLRNQLSSLALQLKFDGQVELSQMASDLRLALLDKTHYQVAPVVLYQNY